LNRLQSGQSPANLPVDEFTEQFGGDLKQAAEKLKNLASGNTTGRDLTELKGIFKNLTSRNKHIFGGAAKEIADIEQSIPEIKKYNELFTNLNIPFENALKKLPGELLEGEGKFSQSATTRDNFDKLLMDMLSKMKTNKEAGTKLEGVFKTLAKELRETHGVDLYTGEVVDAAKAAAYGLAPRQGNISPAVKDLMPQINKISKDAAVASYRQGYDSHSGFINNVIERLNPKGWGLFGAEVAGDVAGSDIGQKVIKPVANIATKAFNAPSASFQAVASAISKVDPKMAQRLSDAIRSNDKRTINTIMFIVAQNPDMKSIVPVYTPEE
jgi:hypothetical protein